VAKPILIIRIPYDTQNLNNVHESIQNIQRMLTDYHVLAYKENSILELKLEVLNPINANDIDIETLKKELLSKIK
jgi:hypothetical protein